MWTKWSRWELPKEVSINNTIYGFETDFRKILQIFEVFNDNELIEFEKVDCALHLFYPDYREIDGKRSMKDSDMMDAFECMCKFMSGNSEESNQKETKPTYDWENDFNIIISPVNRVAGHDIRQDEYVHWWTFLSYFMEIGECTFSTFVNIRDKKNRGKKLEKWEEEIWKKNPNIRLRKRYDSQTQYDLDVLNGKIPMISNEIQEEIDSLLGR